MKIPVSTAGSPSSTCTRSDCQCNCCDKRAGKHCGEHGNTCHNRCPY
jgi:hypothetical protein